MNESIAVAPAAAFAYLQNIVFGAPMREIGDAQKCEPSTVLRRIRKCEELREHPEWDAIFSALEEHWPKVDERRRRIFSRSFVLDALGITTAQVRGEFADNIERLQKRDALILAGEAPRAAITVNGEVEGSLSRTALLAGLLLGWVEPFGKPGRQVRKFSATERITAAFDLPEPETRASKAEDTPLKSPAWRYGEKEHPLSALLRRQHSHLTPAHLATAFRYQTIYEGRNAIMADAYQAISAALGPRLRMVLDEVCGEGTGLEALERKMQLPARSAKMIVVLALETVEHAGLV